MIDKVKYGELYKKELYEEVIPFWENNSIDREHGGFYTCLLPDGKVYDKSKYVWLQARQVWTFAMLSEDESLSVSRRDEFIKIAEDGAKFLCEYGRDNEEGDWYFSLTQEGEPTVNSYNIFSDCFACMAFVRLGKVTGNTSYSEIGASTFQRILERKTNPKKHFEKALPHSDSVKNFSLPMILSNLVLEMGDSISEEEKTKIIADCKLVVMDEFYDKERDLMLENVGLDGRFVDSYEGRLLNPGHAIEAMWFMMDIAHGDGDSELMEECGRRVLRMADVGWDKEYGGLFYFLDVLNKPLQQLEGDQKLWWPQLELLIALAKMIQYEVGDKDEVEDWFVKVHEYSWNAFRDIELGGEWYGYLHKNGDVRTSLKGGKWKGCFHVPRAMKVVSECLLGR